MMHFVFFCFFILKNLIYIIEIVHILSTLGTVLVDFCCAFFQCYIRVMCLAVMCLKKKKSVSVINFSVCCPHSALCRWFSAVIFSNVTLGCHCNDLNLKNLFLLFSFPHVVHPQHCAGGFLLGFFPMLTLGCNCDALFLI